MPVFRRSSRFAYRKPSRVVGRYRKSKSSSGWGGYGSKESKLSLNKGVRNYPSPRNWEPASQRRGILAPMRGITYAPDRMVTNLRGCQSYTLVGGIGGTMVNSFIYLNDLAHPWGSSGRDMVDHDPLGVIQWEAIYKRYKVFAVTVDMELLNAYTSSDCVVYGVQDADDSYNMSGKSPFDPAEKDGFHLVNMNQSASPSATNVCGQNPRFAQTFQIADIEGLTKVQFKADNSLYAANFGSSPTKRTMLQFGVGNWYGTNNASASICFRITYHVELFDRYSPERS